MYLNSQKDPRSKYIVERATIKILDDQIPV